MVGSLSEELPGHEVEWSANWGSGSPCAGSMSEEEYRATRTGAGDGGGVNILMIDGVNRVDGDNEGTVCTDNECGRKERLKLERWWVWQFRC